MLFRKYILILSAMSWIEHEFRCGVIYSSLYAWVINCHASERQTVINSITKHIKSKSISILIRFSFKNAVLEIIFYVLAMNWVLGKQIMQVLCKCIGGPPKLNAELFWLSSMLENVFLHLTGIRKYTTVGDDRKYSWMNKTVKRRYRNIYIMNECVRRAFKMQIDNPFIMFILIKIVMQMATYNKYIFITGSMWNWISVSRVCISFVLWYRDRDYIEWKSPSVDTIITSLSIFIRLKAEDA